MPATIPILTSGKQKLTILGGVKKNGFVNQRVIYPFLKSFDLEKEFIPSKVDTVSPIMSYNDNVTFPWIEDFEDGSISLVGSGSNTTYDSLVITREEDEVYQFDGVNNKATGKIEIPLGIEVFENSTIANFDLPRSGQEIYLEVNFKCNTEFAVGIYPITSNFVTGVPILNLTSTKDANGTMQWKKTYISLKEDVNDPLYTGADFRVFFNAQTNNTSETPLIYFDNIKLVHF